MFMRNNRAKNGASQPESVSSQDSAGQRKARQLAPNGPIDQSPLDYRFSPNMSSPPTINSGHYLEDTSGSGVFASSYEDKIPYVGERPQGADTLKGR